MSNQHMITAASNLENALHDLQLYQQEIRANYDSVQHDAMVRTQQINDEIKNSMKQMAANSDRSYNTAMTNRIKELQKEKLELEKAVGEAKRVMDEQVPLAQQNAAEIQSFVSKLKMIA